MSGDSWMGVPGREGDRSGESAGPTDLRGRRSRFGLVRRRGSRPRGPPGDCRYENLHVEPNYLTRRRLFPLLDRLLALDVAHYVPGHHDAPLLRSEFESLAQVLRTVGEVVGRRGRDDAAIQESLAWSPDPDAPAIPGFVKAFHAGLAHEID